MKVLLFIAALAVLAVDAQSTSGSYVIVAPAKVRAGMGFSISVNILRSYSPVTVTAELFVSNTKVSTRTGVFMAGSPGTLDMPKPSTSGSSYELKITGTGGLAINETKRLLGISKQLSLHIQTDKGIYKPGDVVNFRTFAVYPDLKFYTGPLTVIIMDAGSNKIKQFVSVTPTKGVFSGKLRLSTQPVLGDWKIKVEALNVAAQEEKTFAVAEYVLPKFEVDVVLPSYVVTTESDVAFTVKAKYTYGKPVKGTADVSVKLLYSWYSYDLSRALPVETRSSLTIDGEVRVTIPISSIKAVSMNLNGHKLIVSANVTESLTGNSMSGNGTVTMHNYGHKLDFPETNPKTFKPGLQYVAYLKVSQQDGLPLSSATGKVTVDVTVTSLKPTTTAASKTTARIGFIDWYPPTETTNLPTQSLVIPSNGLVAIPVDVPDEAKDVRIVAKYDRVSDSLSIGKSHSPSSSYIQLSLQNSAGIQAGDALSFKVKSTQKIDSLVYQVLSRGGLVASGSINCNYQKESTFTVTSDPSMAPNARIVVYYVRKDGEIVTDSISFDVGGAFENKVSVSINKKETLPGSEVTVTVNAEKDSTAYLLAIDQSVLLLRSGNDVTAQDVYDDLKDFDTISNTKTSGGFHGGIGCPNCRRKRSIWWPYPIYYGGSDAKKIFENAGVVVMTDALVYHYQEPPRPRPIMMMRGGGFPMMMRANNFRAAPMAFAAAPMRNKAAPEALMDIRSNLDSQSLAEPERLRANFAETWLWSEEDIGHNGSATITTNIPDTITSWVASGFAYHDTVGLGVAPTQAHLRVFKPFFVSLNLPYSVVRGEHLALQAIVFNYLGEDQTVRVTLSQSSSFFNIKVDANHIESLVQIEAKQDVFVPKGEAKSVYFPIVPSTLGKIDLEVKAQSTKAADALMRQLLVEPEGTPKEFNIPVLIDLTSNTAFSKTIDITLPPQVVAGSELFRISAVGDLMGPTITNIDSLLRMPTGCGEQTMLGLAPDVYVTDYLSSVKQLTNEIKEKVLNYMESGYQRELTYKHKDHSFSAFGERDPSGSMWLTAFVSRVFHQASSHITVDPEVIERAVKWMISKQNANGSFPEPGRVIHKDMQGQAGQGVGLTTFVLISMLENEAVVNSVNTLAKSKALAYLEAEVKTTNDVYVLAMASYALQLAGSSEAQNVLDRLEKLAIVKDGTKHWHKPTGSSSTKTGSWHRPNPTSATDTEMTAYILLTYAAKGDIVGGKPIMQWITQQRNANGGFTSTQDTVVALQALSEYAKLTYSNNFKMNVQATCDSSPKYSFTIDNTNSLLLQTKESTTIPSKVSISAAGNGIALMQVSVFFNVNNEVEDLTFDVALRLLQENMNYLVLETCTTWLGEGEASSMALQEIGIPTGFTPDLESITSLTILKKIETQNKKIILYLDEIGTKPVCINVKMDRTGLVAKSQPSAVRVIDYYEPGNQATAFYQSQLLQKSTVCDVCKECENCV